MNNDKIKNITVLGTGNMGPGIAFQFARRNFKVIMWGPTKNDTKTGFANLHTIIDEMVLENILEYKSARLILSDVMITRNLKEAAENAHMIIEAIPEVLELKQNIYSKIENICSPDTIIASNTSTLLPSDLSEKMVYRNRFLVAHFWNPAYLAPLVEVCGSSFTSIEVIDITMKLLKNIGNEPVLIRKEILGFIGNRIMHAMNREALALIGNGVCKPDDIDRVVLSSFGPRFANLGPMEYLDFSGLNLIQSIQKYLYSDLDITNGVLPIINKLVSEGSLGIKTGRGLFDWSKKENKIRFNRDKEFIQRLKSNKMPDYH